MAKTLFLYCALSQVLFYSSLSFASDEEPATNNNSFVGDQYEVWLDINIDTHINLSVRIATFARGDYIQSIPNSKNVDSFGLSLSYIF